MVEIILYIACIVLTIFSWGFVNPGAPYPKIALLLEFVNSHRPSATLLYVLLFAVLFVLYARILFLIKQKRMTIQPIRRMIVIAAVLLFVGFPGFSYDVFNYMATAKVAYTWGENPYIVMPIEIPNEPMLAYMHAANKIALYGPVWIAFTWLPHTLGMGNPLATVYMFKLVSVAFFALTLWLLWRMSGKSIWSFAFFALNPLVLTETVLSGHNDIVMMGFALGAFYILGQKKYIASAALLVCSIGIKYASVLLVPVYGCIVLSQRNNKRIKWETIWTWSATFMYAAFLLSPIREEIYAWYFIWPLVFLSLIPSGSLLVWLSYGFTFGLPYRIAPFLYSLTWSGITPLVKQLVTGIPPLLTGTYGYFKNR